MKTLQPQLFIWSRLFWTFLLLAAGIAHFLHLDFFLAYYPSYLPWPKAAIWGTGILEFGLAILLWTQRGQKMAYLGIALLMLCYLPVHVYVITDHARIVHPVPAIPLYLAWLRLPVQGVFVFWAYYLWRNTNKHQ
jgi:uncharacterized membrane protein